MTLSGEIPLTKNATVLLALQQWCFVLDVKIYDFRIEFFFWSGMKLTVSMFRSIIYNISCPNNCIAVGQCGLLAATGTCNSAYYLGPIQFLGD